MRITTWNVNSVRQRLGHLLDLLKEAEPDVVCLQELKCTDDAFPRAEVEAAGYRVETYGQKGFNGVALVSKEEARDVRRGLPGEEADAAARYIEASFPSPSGDLRVASIYAPNGNPQPGPKYDAKRVFMDRLAAHARAQMDGEAVLVLAGDYNVIPEPRDVARPEAWVQDALFLPESRAMLRRLEMLGLVDALRACDDRAGLYTFWDYQAGAWSRNDGIRIDHLLLAPQAADRLISTVIHKHVRGWDKPSDHVPVTVELTD
jgi:exodeoxyribonuclease III